MAEKKTQLSIVIRTVDRATAKLKEINERLEAATKPFRDFKEQLSDLRENSGLDDVIGGFKGVGSAIAGVLAKVALIGGVVAVAVHGLFSLVDEFDELGDKAERIGVGVDFLAQMRHAAEMSGASVEDLDGGLQNFTKSLGQARANTGRMASFLTKVSPALLRQVKAAKSNEEAFDLLAGAMAKLEDPAKRAALAQAAFGNTALAPLFKKGPEGLKKLREEFFAQAGSLEGAAKAAGETDDAMKGLKAATTGVKAALVEGLAPALTDIVTRLRDWFRENRENVREWAIGLGKKLPGAVSTLIDVFKSIINFIRPFVDSATKLKVIAVVLAGIIVGPLVSAIYTLGAALLATPVGWIVGALALIAAEATLIITHWEEVSGFFIDLWDTLVDKFGWAAHIIKLVLLPITGIATILIGAWTPIKNFFVDLWNGITAAFQKAADIILGIVGKIVEAVDFVTEKIKSFINGNAEGRALIADVIGGGLTPEQRDAFVKGDIGAQARNALAGGSSSTAKITVDVNGPAGTRVKADPQNTADVDLSLGVQMFPGGL